ncbi:MAG: alpha/beta hydrolase [Gemmatimonadetes bacterium]|nr:alpha/beta hydrolase [Gemmatimonadota bacterium]
MPELPYERALREWVEVRGMTHERLTYPRPDAGGETLAYRFTPAEEPRALLLVAHGAGNDALFAFPGFFKELLQQRFEVFTFDMDGHGRESTTRFSFPAVAGAIPDALAQARAGRPELPVHAVGLSLGGAILLSSLPTLDDQLSSAVLISAPLRIRFGVRRVLTELRPSLLGAWLRQREHCGLWGLVPSFGPVKRGLYPLRLAEEAEGAFGYIERLNEALEQMQLERAAGRVRIPVLLVYGTRDRIVPPVLAEELALHLPECELLWVKGGTHLTTFFAEEAHTGIFRWLDARTAREAESRRE